METLLTLSVIGWWLKGFQQFGVLDALDVIFVAVILI